MSTESMLLKWATTLRRLGEGPGANGEHEPRAAVLNELRKSPGYGLDIADRVLASTGICIDHEVYEVLRALETEGIVESYKGETAPGRNGRPRIYYRMKEAT